MEEVTGSAATTVELDPVELALAHAALLAYRASIEHTQVVIYEADREASDVKSAIIRLARKFERGLR